MHKNMVLTLVERGGSARSFHVDSASIADITPILRQNIRRESGLMTDEARHYMESAASTQPCASTTARRNTFAAEITTNTVEGYYSIFKRGMKGVYQHCARSICTAICAEFDFRYSNRVALGVDDEARADNALKGIAGKRLTYRGPRSFPA